MVREQYRPRRYRQLATIGADSFPYFLPLLFVMMDGEIFTRLIIFLEMSASRKSFFQYTIDLRCFGHRKSNYAFKAFAIFRATARGAKRVENAVNLFLKPEMAIALFFMNAA